MKEFIIKYWLEVLFTGVITALSFCTKKLYKRMKKEMEEQKAIKEGLIAMLHDRLYQLCNYYIDRGYCTTEERRNLEYLYKAYHGLGGNGTGTDLYLNCTKLPYSPPDEDIKADKKGA